MVRSVKERGKYEYTKKYTDLAGVELGGSESNISGSRLAYLENMYRDYEGEGGGLIESVPGYRRVLSLPDGITALYPMKGEVRDYIIVRAGKHLYRIAVDERDNIKSPEPLIELKGEKSAVFPYGKSLYFTDCDRLIRIGEIGIGEVIGEDMPYAPTVRLNGEIFEEKNLLTSSAKEEFVLADVTNYSWGHPALRYKILDREMHTCAVSGVHYSPTGVVQVPSTVMINGKRHRVKEIMPKAFSICNKIEEIYIAEGIERIGTLAFNYCKALMRVVMPSTISEIGDAVFQECDELEDVYLGAGINSIGTNPFVGTSHGFNIHYAGNEDNLEDVNGIENLGERIITCESEDRRTIIECPISEKCTGIRGVTLNGESIEYSVNNENDRVRSVTLTSDKFYDGECDIVIDVTLAKESFSVDSEREISDVASLIGGMTVAEVFDGRVFLSGNPSLPNTIIYSARTRRGVDTPLYFGSECYMNDGVGGYPVVAMLAVRDSLAVFKSGDDGTGSIFYHTQKETGDGYIPKIYPVEYVHSGIGAVGGAISFLDDPVFLSSGGLMALTQKAINYERSIAHRSHNVNFDLLKRNIRSSSMTEWLGYLVIGIGDTVYLADSRAMFKHPSGSYEYEWFLISGVGEYKNSTRVYRYDSYEKGEYKRSRSEGDVARGVVYSVQIDGEKLFYTVEDGKKYTVYPTREMRGGDFYPATCYLAIGDLLFFGTSGGGLFLFNNDKRGVAPASLSQKDDFDEGEYKREMGRSIHPEFYSFDSHAPRYAIRTASDSCGIPHLTKSTIHHSLVLKYKAFTSSEIKAEVLTDRGTYKEICLSPATSLCFDELNFENMALTSLDYNTLPISEKEKNWVEKQITIYSDKFESPIGIYSIVYRYLVKGRIKNS